MNVGSLFLLIALIFFFLAGIGMGPASLMVWGLFSLTLGLLLAGFPIPRGQSG